MTIENSIPTVRFSSSSLDVLNPTIYVDIPEDTSSHAHIANLEFLPPEGKTVYAFTMIVNGGDFHILRLEAWTNKMTFVGDAPNFEADPPEELSLHCDFFVMYTDGTSEYVDDVAIVGRPANHFDQPSIVEKDDQSHVVEKTDENHLGEVIKGTSKGGEMADSSTPIIDVSQGDFTVEFAEGTEFNAKLADITFTPPEGKEVIDFTMFVFGGDTDSITILQYDNTLRYVSQDADFENTENGIQFELNCAYLVYFDDGTYEYVEGLTGTAIMTDVDEQPTSVEKDDQSHLVEKTDENHLGEVIKGTSKGGEMADNSTPIIDVSQGDFTVEFAEGGQFRDKLADLVFTPPEGKNVDFFAMFVDGGDENIITIDQYDNTLRLLARNSDFETAPNGGQFEILYSYLVYFDDGTFEFIEGLTATAIMTDVDEQPTSVEKDDQSHLVEKTDENNLGEVIKGTRGDDVLVGKADADILRGGRGDDKLDGGAGDDFLKGGKGKDTLFGGTGDDRLEGGRGHDTLVGGIGTDTLKGGKGRDLFIVDVTANESIDTIADFTRGKDTINLRYHTGDVFWQRMGDDVRLTTSTVDKAFLVLRDHDVVFAGDFIDSQINLVEII